MNLHQIIDQIYPLPPHSKEAIEKLITSIHYPKGYVIINADKIEKNLYFIKKGIARAYSVTPDDELTFWFGKEGDVIISMKSYIEKTKGYENIELLEDSELYELKIDDLKKLYDQDINLSNWGRCLAEKELIKSEGIFISRQTKNATERYIELLEKTPHLVQRVLLRHIASYLGITQVSLSRIRAEIK